MQLPAYCPRISDLSTLIINWRLLEIVNDLLIVYVSVVHPFVFARLPIYFFRPDQILILQALHFVASVQDR